MHRHDHAEFDAFGHVILQSSAAARLLAAHASRRRARQARLLRRGAGIRVRTHPCAAPISPALFDQFARGWRGYVLIALIALLSAASSARRARRYGCRRSALRASLAANGRERRYVRIRLQDEERNRKPVGAYWLQAASARAFRPTAPQRDLALSPALGAGRWCWRRWRRCGAAPRSSGQRAAFFGAALLRGGHARRLRKRHGARADALAARVHDAGDGGAGAAALRRRKPGARACAAVLVRARLRRVDQGADRAAGGGAHACGAGVVGTALRLDAPAALVARAAAGAPCCWRLG